MGGSFFEEDDNGLPNEGEEENVNEEDMPPKLAKKATAPTLAAAATSVTAAKPPPPAPACSLFAAYSYSFTNKYTDPEQQKFMIDLVIHVDGSKVPSVRVRNSATLSVTTQHNKLAFVNLGESLGLPESSTVPHSQALLRNWIRANSTITKTRRYFHWRASDYHNPR